MNQQTPTLTRRVGTVDYPISPAHPAADAFPWIEEAELKELAADIAAHGQHQPIVRLPDGRIVDGRNRELACRIAEVAPTYETRELTEGEVIDLVLSVNIQRRHLNPSQRAIAAAELANLKRGRPVNGTRDAFTQTEAADLFGVSRKTVQRATRVREDAPELMEPIKAGQLDVNTALEVSKLPQRDRQRVATAADPKQEATRTLAARKPEPLPNLAPEPEPAPTPAGEQVKDKFGRIVPASLAPLFVAGRQHASSSSQAFKEWMQSQQAAAVEAWGEAIGDCLPTMEQELKDTVQHVRASIPYCVCPHVNGEGVHELPGKCKACVRNRGWLSRHNYHQLQDSVKALIEEMANEPKSEHAPTQTAVPADEFQPFATSSSKHTHTTKRKAGAA